MFYMPSEEEITLEKLNNYLQQHQVYVEGRYKPLLKAYLGKHEILNYPRKDKWKPDNRIVNNFPKYIVDTMNGFFMGIPVRITSEDDSVNEYISLLNSYSDQEDNDAELSKISSIFGKGYEMYYLDDKTELCITYLNPIEAFMIFDTSILVRPKYFVRVFQDIEGNKYGSISNEHSVRYFDHSEDIKWTDEWSVHGFSDVPATEYIENAEKMGIFESVLTQINALNKAVSEKANDVDYFADAYFVILGEKLDNDTAKNIRDNRLVNFEGDTDKLIVKFLEKPSADKTQENLIDRLEDYIFQLSMTANISDESFGTSSGEALKFKLKPMTDLAKTKERKFQSGMQRRYKLLFGHVLSRVPADSWLGLEYTFSLNMPSNELNETQIAKNLIGITSRETAISQLSFVKDVSAELEKIREEAREQEQQSIEDMMNLITGAENE